MYWRFVELEKNEGTANLKKINDFISNGSVKNNCHKRNLASYYHLLFKIEEDQNIALPKLKQNERPIP